MVDKSYELYINDESFTDLKLKTKVNKGCNICLSFNYYRKNA